MKSDFYQIHLNRVSRSFAFGISELQEPLREYVGFAYLFCRLIDTIEDATWPVELVTADQHLTVQVTSQQKQFIELVGFLDQMPSETVFKDWQSKIPQGLPAGEQLLLADSYQLFEDYHHLPKQVREILRGPFVTMVRGMSAFVSVRENNEIRLRNLLELDHYCFFVAGVVGEILTGLAYYQYTSKDKPAIELFLESFHFGLFLQKINILKDYVEDTQRGLFFFDNRNELVGTLHEHATKAKDYLLSLPETWWEYRLFCAFSLCLGLISLPLILTPSEGPQKLPRDHTKMLMNHLRELNSKPSNLRDFIQSGIDQIPMVQTRIFSIQSDQIQTGRGDHSRFDPGCLYEGLLSRDTIRKFFTL